MKNKNLKIFIVLLLVVINLVTATSLFAKTPKLKAKISAPKQAVEIKKNIVTLDTPEHIYTTEVIEGATVYDAMVSIRDKKDNKFSFHSKNYGDLGNFIDEINGLKGTPGKYWMYYINNKKATLGVSKYVLKPEDRISWKQEGF